MSLSDVSPTEPNELLPSPNVVGDFKVNPSLLIESGAGGSVYLDGDTAVKIFHPATYYPHMDPQELLRENIEEIALVSRLGQIGIAPRFLGLVRDSETGGLGFRMDYIDGVQLDELPLQTREIYRERILELGDTLTDLGYGSLGDIEVMLSSPSKRYESPELVEIRLVDLTSLYPLTTVDPKERARQIEETTKNFSFLIDQRAVDSSKQQKRAR